MRKRKNRKLRKYITSALKKFENMFIFKIHRTLNMVLGIVLILIGLLTFFPPFLGSAFMLIGISLLVGRKNAKNIALRSINYTNYCYLYTKRLLNKYVFGLDNPDKRK